MSDNDIRERCEACYSGRVQGVGFRYTVRRLATRFAVAGFVKNLSDGRVEVVAEGEAAEVRRFLDAIGAEMGYYIAEIRSTSGPATGRLEGFEIRF